jgi:hypothetical protein
VAKPSLVILLVEDRRHEQFISKYLQKGGLGRHAMRVVMSPSGAGSAEKWVRERFLIEVEACRTRQAQTKLIVLIDADAQTVQQRVRQLDLKLRDAGVPAIPADNEQIARLIPKRNIETWILCLNDILVDEDTDYKNAHDRWTVLTFTAAGRLYAWTRANATVPTSCTESLHAGVLELRKINL